MPTLFRTLLGEDFDRLPCAVRTLHGSTSTRTFHGHVAVRGAEGVLARIAARVSGLPQTSGASDFAVTIEHDGDAEIWTRHFPQRRMRSRLWHRDGLLHERLGSVELRFRLEADVHGIRWHPVSARSFAGPMPRRLLNGIRAREHDGDGRYRFDVGAEFPWIGHVVDYRGWLDVG